MKKYKLKPLGSGDLTLVQPRTFTLDYRRELNDAQFEAVTSVDGPHLIIAGAGTGKTQTVVYRVAYLVELGVKPENVLLLTFTRKAAQEMLRRAAILLDSRCERVSGGTFHSFANMLLRKHASLIGFEPTYSILDQGDAEDVINLIRTRLKFDTKEKRFPRKETLYDLYSRSVNTQTSLTDLLALDYPHYLEQEADIQSVHHAYERYKKVHNLMDYDDLLVNLVVLFRNNEAVRRAISDRYKYVMVDEYQDTNRIQADIVAHLGHRYRNVMVVGDDAQAIYGFRGSTIKNIVSFPKEFAPCKVIKLQENYRSTQPILDLANEILRRSPALIDEER
ncbi:MAG: ATP-dependent helicase [Ignavibacteria bacterium]|nr:ATP-dependent helicase [Ignavibacteria bacterium]